MRTMVRCLAGATAAVLSMAALAAAAPASAALSVSDGLYVYDASGALIASAVQSEADEVSGAIVVVPIAIDQAQFGNATNLLEPGTTGGTGFSDIYGICTCGPGGALALGFASDDETQLVNFGSFPRTFPETGKGFDATLYLAQGLRDAGDTAMFFSDSEVPEPATWAMMLVGFGLAGAALRRRGMVRSGA